LILAGRGKARHGKAGLGMTRQDKTRAVYSRSPITVGFRVETPLGAASPGWTWLGRTRQGFTLKDDMSNQPEFRLSSDSKALAKMLIASGPGEVVLYEDLDKAIGRDVREAASGALHTARHIAQREHRMVFDAVRGVGLKRLADSEIVDLADKARDHARRHASRTAKKLTCVDYDALSKDKQTKHNAALSMFSVMAELSTDKAQKRLESKVKDADAQLPNAKAAIEALGAVL
jgi:hypothetical protein